MTYEEMRKYIADMVKSAFYGNSNWGDVRSLLQEKTYITIQSATA